MQRLHSLYFPYQAQIGFFSEHQLCRVKIAARAHQTGGEIVQVFEWKSVIKLVFSIKMSLKTDFKDSPWEIDVH